MYNINNQYYPRSFMYPTYQTQYVPAQAYNYVQQPIMQQQSMQPAQQNQPIDYPISDIRFLNADQIKGFIPPIGSRVILVDRDNNIAYLETTDYMGNFSKEMYSITKIKESNAQPDKEASTFVKQEDIENFVTKKDLESVSYGLSDLKVEMDKLNKQIQLSQIKGDK